MKAEKGRDDFRPKKRSKLRMKAGSVYYTLTRHALWLKYRDIFAKRGISHTCEYLHFEHKSPLRRGLRGEELKYQDGKIKNLSIAVPLINEAVIRPGQVFSYWQFVGKPDASRGYTDGMVLNGGKVEPGIGGGLCQLSNLVYWLTLHTPLSVIERHRHGYDVFPDVSRTQPFGSGATCAYPYLDFMVRNYTGTTFKLEVWMDEDYLYGAWYSDAPPEFSYEIIEKNHEMRAETFGGFSRHNEIWRLCRNEAGDVVSEDLMAENHAMMMYSPLIEDKSTKEE